MQWAEQLISDGVDVVLDVWNLREGNDKYVFMEQMVADESVTHVLVFSDSEYAVKADERRAGVGTESQIISQEVYRKVQQSKFLPVVCEFDASGEPFLPTFLKSRIWIDFSSPEAVNNNWEQLIRVIYGKPAYEKPVLGKAPTYVTNDISVPASPVGSKFVVLKQALVQEKRGLKAYRQDFLNACYEYADTLRIRTRPEVEDMGYRVLEDCRKLKLVRDNIVDWILLESSVNPSKEFDEALVSLLERLLELKSRPMEIQSWQDSWFEAHGIFVYETFLYIVAALMETDSLESLNCVLTTHYLLPETEVSRGNRFGTFQAFFGSSSTLQILAPEGKRLLSPAAEFIKRQADRTDLSFNTIMQAELLVLMMAFVSEDGWWYPQTLHYASRSGAFPFFLKAERHRDFQKLAKITGIDDAATLQAAVKIGHERLKVNEWHDFWVRDRSFWSTMNMDALDRLL